MSTGTLIGNLVFSSVGFVAFVYGKKTMRFRVMILGGVLMAFPYFVSDAALMWAVGSGLTCGLVFLKD